MSKSLSAMSASRISGALAALAVGVLIAPLGDLADGTVLVEGLNSPVAATNFALAWHLAERGPGDLPRPGFAADRRCAVRVVA